MPFIWKCRFEAASAAVLEPPSADVTKATLVWKKQRYFYEESKGFLHKHAHWNRSKVVSARHIPSGEMWLAGVLCVWLRVWRNIPFLLLFFFKLSTSRTSFVFVAVALRCKICIFVQSEKSLSRRSAVQSVDLHKSALLNLALGASSKQDSAQGVLVSNNTPPLSLLLKSGSRAQLPFALFCLIERRLSWPLSEAR